MKLVEVQIVGLGKIRNSSFTTDRKLTAILGPNEAGESTLLRALVSLNDDSTISCSARNRTSVIADDDVIVEAEYRLEPSDTEIHSGDSDYDRRMLAASARGPLDAALLCMNGTGGNMNVWEAATLAAQLTPRIAVPMHWGMRERAGYGPTATLDPNEFVSIYSRLAGGHTVITEMGVSTTLSA